MKTIKRLSVLLLVVLLFTTVVPSQAFAANRQYTVRIYAGNYGTFSGGGKVFVDNTKPYSETARYDYPAVTPSDGYYVKGIKESGKDASVTENKPILTQYKVSEDRDYVVAYGIKGKDTSYTVHYVLKGSTTELASPKTFYADVGDTVLPAAVFIDGYQPDPEPKAQKIKGNDSFTVTYSKLPETKTIYYSVGGGTTTVSSFSQTSNTNANSGQNTNTATAIPNAANVTSQTAPLTQQAQQAQPQQAVVTRVQETDDVLALEESLEEPAEPEPAELSAGVGVFAPEDSSSTAPQKHSSGLLIAGAAVLVGLVGAMYWYLLFYRKKKKLAGMHEVDYDFSFLDEQDDYDDFGNR